MSNQITDRLIYKISKYLKTVEDLRNASEASPRCSQIIEKHSLRDQVLGGNCWGCWNNQPNQLAHMDYGGCLYQDDEPDCCQRGAFLSWSSYVSPKEYSFSE